LAQPPRREDPASNVFRTARPASKRGAIQAQAMEKAIKDLDLDPEKSHPRFV
jgi:hypothetical protein